ncbi:MAG: EAL domain-containing protein [Rhodocyclales bacterium]|nr:EAL domain-containing protein [Rhodocyclales bacterium]
MQRVRVGTGFHLSLAIGALLIAAAIAALGFVQWQAAEAVERNKTLDNVVTEGLQLVQLTNEVLLYKQERAVTQWRGQFDHVTAAVGMALGPADGSDVQLRKIDTRLTDMRLLFERLASPDADHGDSRAAQDVAGILSSQLFQKTVLLQTSLRSLKTFSDDQIKGSYDAAKERTLLTFGLLAALMALFGIVVSVLFRNVVLRPLQGLELAIRRVNAGDAKQRADLCADDEIGMVSRAFNGLLDQQEEHRRQLQYLAYHDVLTGLPNQLLVKDRLVQAIAFAGRSGNRVALLFLDLDNFKTINDSLGHPVGDALLRAVSERLVGCIRDTDTVARQGGDEFLVILSDVQSSDDIAALAEKLLERLTVPFQIEGHDLSTSASIGIAIHPDDSRDFDTLLKKADTALYEAKAAGRNAYRFFTERMNVEASEYLQVRSGLRRAIENREFELHYQPQIDLATGALVGVEALIRWQHPQQGWIPPARFIPVAEDSGLIVAIGEWVLREACRQLAEWRSSGLPELTVAVNLSGVQFKRGMVERSVMAALQEFDLPARLLELELTESILIKDTESVLATVRRLKDIGVRLSIDDFGTGYSSLSYLKRFNVDKLKIDQSFVRDFTSDPDDAAIVRAIIQMARSLNLRTIAEGVETAHVRDQLAAFNCDEAQGYYFARPMPAADFERFVAARASSS